MVKAVSALTYLAEEVRMLVIVVLLAVTVAEFIFRAVAAALNRMHQMMFPEQGEKVFPVCYQQQLIHAILHNEITDYPENPDYYSIKNKA